MLAIQPNNNLANKTFIKNNISFHNEYSCIKCKIFGDTNNNIVYDPIQKRFILYCRPRHAFRGWIDPRDA